MIVATARTPRAIRKIAGHENLGRIVCANGALCWDARRDTVIRERCFDPTGLAAAVLRVREALPDAGIALLSAETMLLDDTYVGLRRKGASGAETFCDLDAVVSNPTNRDGRSTASELTAEESLAATAAAFVGVGVASFAGLGAVDVSPEGTTKAVAAAKEMTESGCPAKATVVFGDMPNDLPLFAWAGWSCAMANGHPEVLAAADEVVPSNDDDDVARSVPRLLELGEMERAISGGLSDDQASK